MIVICVLIGVRALGRQAIRFERADKGGVGGTGEDDEDDEDDVDDEEGEDDEDDVDDVDDVDDEDDVDDVDDEDDVDDVDDEDDEDDEDDVDDEESWWGARQGLTFSGWETWAVLDSYPFRRKVRANRAAGGAWNTPASRRRALGMNLSPLGGMSREQPTFPFQKLDVYVAARELVVLVGTASVADRELRDQVTRASASVLLRLSEGLPHRGQGLRQKYFAEAQGSLHEVAAALDVAAALGRLDPEVAREGLALAFRVRGMILGLQR